MVVNITKQVLIFDTGLHHEPYSELYVLPKVLTSKSDILLEYIMHSSGMKPSPSGTNTRKKLFVDPPSTLPQRFEFPTHAIENQYKYRTDDVICCPGPEATIPINQS